MFKGLKYSILAASVMLALSACNEDATKAKTTTAAPAAKKEVVQNKADQNTKDTAKEVKEAPAKDFGSLEKNASYALGSMLGSDLKQNFVEANKNLQIIVDPELIKQGFNEALADKSQLTREQAVASLEKFQEMFEAKAKEQANKKSAENLQKGKDFLAQNAKKENVKVTKSGLQYIVKVEGTGEKVKDATDIVKVVYTGKLIDGKVFDSNSGEGKQPIEFPLQNVIPGWTEGLQLMSVGSEYTFFIPSELAYGDRDTGFIPANSVLIFDVKLLDVKHKDGTKAEEKKPEVKEEVKAQAEEAKAQVQEVIPVIDDVDLKAELAKEALDQKAEAVKAAVDAKAEAVKEELSAAKEAVDAKAEAVKEAVDAKVEAAKEAVDTKVDLLK